MTDLSKLYVQNHRDQQYMLIGGMMIALMGSLAPRSERALFITGGEAPVAFAAIAPPPVAFNGLFDDAAPYGTRPFRIGAPRRGPGVGGPAPKGFAPAGPASVAPGGVTPAAGAVSPGPLASLDPAGPGITGAPLAGSGPTSFGPGATAAGPGTVGNPAGPGGGGTGGGGGTAPATPVGPVPEPATWAMMLLGFFGLGLILRRGRSAISSVRADRLRT